MFHHVKQLDKLYALAFDYTLSIRINFSYDLAVVPPNNKTDIITYLKIHNYNSEKFLKTTEPWK